MSARIIMTMAKRMPVPRMNTIRRYTSSSFNDNVRADNQERLLRRIADSLENNIKAADNQELVLNRIADSLEIIRMSSSLEDNIRADEQLLVLKRIANSSETITRTIWLVLGGAIGYGAANIIKANCD
jgi:hypothetical protein